MSTQFRRERVSELLLAFIGEELRAMRDPRLSLITVTGIEVSKDYRYAKVFWSALESVATDAVASEEGAEEREGVNDSYPVDSYPVDSSPADSSPVDSSPAGRFLDEAAIAETKKALDGVRGLLKKRIGAELELRFIPNIQFHYDDSGETASRIDQLLRQAGLFGTPPS